MPESPASYIYRLRNERREKAIQRINASLAQEPPKPVAKVQKPAAKPEPVVDPKEAFLESLTASGLSITNFTDFRSQRRNALVASVNKNMADDCGCGCGLDEGFYSCDAGCCSIEVTK